MSHDHLYNDDLLLEHAGKIEERLKAKIAADWTAERANARAEDGWHQEYETDLYIEALFNFAIAFAARAEAYRAPSPVIVIPAGKAIPTEGWPGVIE